MVAIRIPVLIRYLGFANIHLPYDKLIHFVTFFVLTTEFYFVFDTKLKSLKTLRYITLSICTIAGGIGSEIIQSLVNPNRIFDPLDIAFNISGSLLSVGLSSWYQSSAIKKSKEQRNRYRHVPGQEPDIPTHTTAHNSSDADEEGYVSIQLNDTAADKS
ncbi:hypothetical protein DFJ63DRAFT_313068 [Scheffersomyces coipomensis]|uniref:uncharacterized protein n=1 Tax=Scheffersomyces coipomensis TaxID=1788519 RepID=UPI00315D7B70